MPRGKPGTAKNRYKQSKSTHPSRGCWEITFKRAKKGGRILPKSQWVTVERCRKTTGGKKKRLRAHNKAQCRRGGPGWKRKVKSNPRAALFAKC